MAPDFRRMLLAASMPLVYAAIAYSTIFSADRRFDESLRRDRSELEGQLREHGMSAAQAADVVRYEASVAHGVTGYVGSVALAVIGMTMFLGVTLGSILGAPRKPDSTAAR